MPPKKQEVTKKMVQKEAKQDIEDKTFGLKNKNKSKKVQDYCQSIEKNIQNKAKAMMERNKPTQSQADQAKAEKEAERVAQQMALLRQTLKQPKVPEGEDPRNYMCIYFQYSCCDKGDRCKYSHGEKVRIKTEQELLEEKLQKEVELEEKRKRDLGFYSEDMGSLDVNREMRDQILEYRARQLSQKNSTDYSETLQDLKQRETEKLKNFVFSDKICDFFVQACKDGIIGFGWVCPNEKNSNTCQYKHWIPEGYELFKKEEMDLDLDYEELEDKIERQRAEILQGTPVVQETFLLWKQKRLEMYKQQDQEVELQKEKEGGWTGRQIFEKGIYRRDGEVEELAGEDDDVMAQWRQLQKQKADDEAKIEAEAALKAQKEAEEEEAKRALEQQIVE